MTQWRTFIQPPRQGLSHIEKDLPCQDYAVQSEGNGRTVLVLADGLGMLKRSELAAKAVTTAVAGFLQGYSFKPTSIEPLPKDRILDIARDALYRQAEESQLNASDLDCTLLFAVILYNESRIITGQIGDGAICVMYETRVLRLRSLDGTKVSTNMTKTLMSSNASDYFYLKSWKMDDIKGILLVSDGLENEIYSKAGGAKQKIEWYANLISNNEDETCVKEIDERWNLLTSDASYGFSDDMSLAVAVEKGINFNFPDEVNWLCACGHRNRMESTYCENCGADILDVYSGINYKKTPQQNKKRYFAYLNFNPAEEIKVLRNHSLIPLSPALLNSLKKQDEAESEVSLDDDRAMPSAIQERATAMSDEGNKKASSSADDLQVMNLHQVNNDSSREPKHTMPNANTASEKTPVVNSAENNHTKIADKNEPAPVMHAAPPKDPDRNPFEDRIRNLKNIITVLAIAVAFTLGFLTHVILSQKTHKENAESLQDEITVLQEENEQLEEDNHKKDDIISAQAAQLEVMENLPKQYDAAVTEDGFYIGSMHNGIPDGIGTVFKDNSITTGYYEDGDILRPFFEYLDNGTVKVYNNESDNSVIPNPFDHDGD